MMRKLLFGLLIALVPSFQLSASDRAMTEVEAKELVERYIDLHNRHMLNETMELYADDAVFQLNAGRPEVRGKAEIGKLELFDVYAQSHLQPYGLAYYQEEDGWKVDIAGVMEHSRIFAALGMTIVNAQEVKQGFVLRHGKIARIVQPELNPACSRIAIAGFGGLVQWLEESGDYRASELISEGRLALTPARIPLIVKALEDWRKASGWRPDAGEVRACATPAGY